MASDGTLTVAEDQAREHGLLNYLCVDLDGAWSLSELELAVDHKVIDAVEEVSHLAFPLLYNLREVLEHLPLDGRDGLRVLDHGLHEEDDFIFEGDVGRIGYELKDRLKRLLHLIFLLKVLVSVDHDAQNDAALVENYI